MKRTLQQAQCEATLFYKATLCEECASLDFRKKDRKKRPTRPRYAKRSVWNGNAHRFPMMLLAKATPWSGILPIGPPDDGFVRVRLDARRLGKANAIPLKGTFLKGNKTPCRENMLEAIASKPGQRRITDYSNK